MPALRLWQRPEASLVAEGPGEIAEALRKP